MNKRITALLLALVMLAAAMCCACSGRSKNDGTKVKDNIARIYERNARKSHFMLNDKPIEGYVDGMAYMSTSAFGDRSLAWVGSTLYYVCADGIEKLGSGIEIAEISFDGKTVLWLDNTTLKKYNAEDGSQITIAEELDSVVQFSISPNSSTILCTVIYSGEDSGEYVTLKCDKDGVKEYARNIICFAVSDNGSVVYYYDMVKKGFYVSESGNEHLISEKCSAATNYNFTRDLSEVTYNEAGGLNHLFCLDTKSDTTFGSGFGFTEKTDVFSISTVTFFTYINDVDSFRGGVWMERRTVEDSYVFDLGYINSAGEISWLVNDAVKYFVEPDQSRILWLSPFSNLVSTSAPDGKKTELASDIVSFDYSAKSDTAYCISATDKLYAVKGTGSAKLVDENVSRIAVIGDKCAYIKDDGSVYYAAGTKTAKVEGVSGAVRFDQRVSMLILYVNEHDGVDGTPIYDAYYTGDGVTYTPAYNDVEP